MSGRRSPLDELLAALVGQSSKNENGDDEGRSRKFRSLLHAGNEDPLLDAALAMLGFTSSEVQKTLTTVSGETLVTVLSSSVAAACKSYFSRLENAALSRNASSNSCFLETSSSQDAISFDDEDTCSGTPFSVSSIRKLIGEALSFLKTSKFEGRLIVDLLEVLVKVYSMGSPYKSRLFGSCLLYEREEELEETLASTLLDHLVQFSLERREEVYSQFSPSIRLLLWRLQPGLLVQDLSTLLEMIAERPLLLLRYEFRRRQGWYNLLVAMAYGPDVFKEGRQTLNAWLLASGAPCVWELKVELGVLIRDVLEHPSSWNLSVEAGISLPPLSAFYSGTLHSLAMMLSRPPSWLGLKELGILLENKVAQDAGYAASSKSVDSMRDLRGMEAYRDMARPDSLWMLLMEFPAWSLFASFSLFQRASDSCESYGNDINVGPGHSDDQSYPNGQEHAVWLSHQETAARYIAWHFSPHDEKLRGLIVEMLRQIVQSWLQIKDKEFPSGPTVKRRRLTTAYTKSINPACDGQKLCLERAETTQREARRKMTTGHVDSFKSATAAVQNWLLRFQECCSSFDGYSLEGSSRVAIIESKQQAKRRLVLNDVGGDVTNSQQAEAPSSQYKSSYLFDSLPLVALSCTSFLHNDAVVHLILHSVMVGSEFLSSRRDVYHESRKGLASKEPSHRTEDFRDACQEPFCLNFMHHSSPLKASGVSRLFKFLEKLDLLEYSLFVNGRHGLRWLDSFNEAMAKQLQLCMRSWCQQAYNPSSLTILDDLQQRASLWAAGAGRDSPTLKAFKQVVQGLDILVASSVMDDTF